jgi:hypothetical protein
MVGSLDYFYRNIVFVRLNYPGIKYLPVLLIDKFDMLEKFGGKFCNRIQRLDRDGTAVANGMLLSVIILPIRLFNRFPMIGGAAVTRFKINDWLEFFVGDQFF